MTFGSIIRARPFGRARPQASLLPGALGWLIPTHSRRATFQDPKLGRGEYCLGGDRPYVGAGPAGQRVSTVFEDKADEYRAWAAQCLTMAARAKSDEDRQPWLELADKWQRLANEIGQRNRVRQQAQQPQPTKDSN